jgi:hypothetical protein
MLFLGFLPRQPDPGRSPRLCWTSLSPHRLWLLYNPWVTPDSPGYCFLWLTEYRQPGPWKLKN